ncbi:hypothetical protein BDY19DRAFT_926651 [Irpex rosettiformis]|uniref:Uncharacterized protein n=1 Tax=Irpex rosettiformis TaxID=378272 RepID=A0ACB8UEV8_9APHY|nr:hypothetical protein BDY19DRAFT_926651 [Irpex rosettiformis]
MVSTRPFVLIAPASRGLSLALARHYLQSTNLSVYATHRSPSPNDVRDRILTDIPDVDPERLHLLPMELTSESSIAETAHQLKQMFPPNKHSYIHTAFFTGGILHPERQPSDFNSEAITQTFATNLISHLLCIKHFSEFLPSITKSSSEPAIDPAKWVHMSARVGSISDNRLGGWYSYRASKSALNQVIRTFDLHLQRKKTHAICVGMHPGTVKTDLSKEFWGGVPKEKLFEPEKAARYLADVVKELTVEQRGRVWDWAGKEVLP